MKLPERPFLFLRHGETAYNEEGRFQGRIDVPLNQTGREQADAAAEVLERQKFSAIVSSPAQRVLQTIEPLTMSDRFAVHVEPDLMEMSVGSFEGRLITEVRQEHGLHEGDSWLPALPADAEHMPDFEARVLAAVARWTEELAGQTLLIAAHGLVFHVLARALVGDSVYSRNAEPYRFEPRDGGWTVTELETFE